MNQKNLCDTLAIMKEQILLFELNDEKQKLQLKQALMPLRIRLKYIPRTQYHLSVGELTAGEASQIPGGGKSHTPESGESHTSASCEQTQVGSCAADSSGLPSGMLVFCGLSSGRLDAVLAALRRKNIRIPHKAVLTPHNAAWTPIQLFDALDEEHRRFSQSQSSES